VMTVSPAMIRSSVLSVHRSGERLEVRDSHRQFRSSRHRRTAARSRAEHRPGCPRDV
jgi:hypothetical protein